MHHVTTTTRRTCRGAALILLLVSALAAPVSAQQPEPSDGAEALGPENSAFAVSAGTSSNRPDRRVISLEVFPGQVIEESISIFNFTDQPLDFDVWSGDGYNNSDGAFAIYGSEVSPEGLGSWVELPETGVTVNPASRADLPIRIRVPDNAEPGDHAGGVAALNTTPVEQIEQGSADIDVLRSVGVRIYVRVAGPLHPSLDVRNVRVEPTLPLLPGISGTGRAQIRYEVVNSGNLRLAPTTELSVSGPFGIGRTTLEPVELRELLPGAAVTMSQTVTGVPSLGRMTTSIDLRAVGLEETRRTVAFWAVPWVYVVVLVLAAGAAWWYRRSTGGDPNDDPPEEVPGPSPEGDPRRDEVLV